jgi:hypothetical protein
MTQHVSLIQLFLGTTDQSAAVYFVGFDQELAWTAKNLAVKFWLVLQASGSRIRRLRARRVGTAWSR